MSKKTEKKPSKQAAREKEKEKAPKKMVKAATKKDEEVEKAPEKLKVKDGKLKDAKELKGAKVAEPAVGKKGKEEPEPAKEKPTRAELIRMRHERMKRAIEEIREDLETDDDEEGGGAGG